MDSYFEKTDFIIIYVASFLYPDVLLWFSYYIYEEQVLFSFKIRAIQRLQSRNTFVYMYACFNLNQLKVFRYKCWNKANRINMLIIQRISSIHHWYCFFLAIGVKSVKAVVRYLVLFIGSLNNQNDQQQQLVLKVMD